MNRNVYVYVFDTMADWETGYAVAELHSGRFFRKDAERFRVQTVGLTKAAVTTMGGVRIVPDSTVDECRADGAAALLLPGGETWLEPMHAPVLEKVREFLREGIVVGAICGATAALAQAGLLDERCHTSNGPGFLQQFCPGYSGEACFRPGPSVVDGRLVTASGTAPLEFARDIIGALDVFTPAALKAWYDLNKTQDPNCFFALMAAVGEKS